MLQLRKWLTSRHEWYELCLQQLAELEGYGHLSRPMVQLCAHIGKEPVSLSDVARLMGVSRQWIARLANEGCQMGILELSTPPEDKRALLVQFSRDGWRMVRLAAGRMRQIEAILAERIGAENLAHLVDILSLDWGPAELTKDELSRLDAKAKRQKSKRAA